MLAFVGRIGALPVSAFLIFVMSGRFSLHSKDSLHNELAVNVTRVLLRNGFKLSKSLSLFPLIVEVLMHARGTRDFV